jgi:hypothetical protein
MEVSGQLHVPAALPPGKNPQYTLHSGQGGPKSWSGHFGGEETFCPCLESKPGSSTP